MHRLVKPALAVLLLVSIGVMFAAFRQGGTEVWPTVAAALAVVVAVVGAWTAQDVVELERERHEPYPYPSIDPCSRYSLLQLCVTNSGGSAARNVRLKWKQPLLKTEGQPVRFTEAPEAPDIAVLPPGCDVRVMIGESHAFFQKYADATYSGEIEFENEAGRVRRYDFYVSAEPFRLSLDYDTEEPKTHHRIQQIPKHLDNIAKAIRAASDS